MAEQECLVCKSISGEQRISPGQIIYENAYWLIEHAYPTALKYWLVIVLKEHKEALHELTLSQIYDLQSIMRKAIPIIREMTGCQKEYVLCLGESPAFQHLHIHIVPRIEDMSEEFKGTKIFQYLKVPADQMVPQEEIKKICQELAEEFKKEV